MAVYELPILAFAAALFYSLPLPALWYQCALALLALDVLRLIGTELFLPINNAYTDKHHGGGLTKRKAGAVPPPYPNGWYASCWTLLSYSIPDIYTYLFALSFSAGQVLPHVLLGAETGRHQAGHLHGPRTRRLPNQQRRGLCLGRLLPPFGRQSRSDLSLTWRLFGMPLPWLAVQYGRKMRFDPRPNNDPFSGSQQGMAH